MAKNILYFVPKNLLLNFTAVSESMEQTSELYWLNLGSKVAPKNGQKYFVPTNLLLNSTAVSESIGQISKLYGFN